MRLVLDTDAGDFLLCVYQVLAGALQDDCRAVLRGERPFGKGLVQAVYGLADGQGLILTVAQYETPRGSHIHVRSPFVPLLLLLLLLLLMLTRIIQRQRHGQRQSTSKKLSFLPT